MFRETHCLARQIVVDPAVRTRRIAGNQRLHIVGEDALRDCATQEERVCRQRGHLDLVGEQAALRSGDSSAQQRTKSAEVQVAIVDQVTLAQRQLETKDAAREHASIAA